MKINFRLLTNKYFFIGFIVFLVGILTVINNFGFYSHVERSLQRDSNQLKDILKDEIKFSRNNRISGVRYRNNIKTIVKNFARNAYYNDSIILKDSLGNLIWKKPVKDWDKVAKSDIEIILPKLKSDETLYYHVYIEFNNFSLFKSIIRSMTFSMLDMGIKIINPTDITIEERSQHDRISIKKDKLSNLKDELEIFQNHFDRTSIACLKKQYENKLLKEDIKICADKVDVKDFNTYFNIRAKVKANKIPREELNKYYELKEKISHNEVSTRDLWIYFYRSRIAIVFTFFIVILLWMFRRREIEVQDIEIELEKEKKNKEILETTFGITEQNEDIKLYEAIINNDTAQLKNIKSINPTMNILKFNAMVDNTEEEKLKILQVLIDKGINLKFQDEEGITVLMYYAIGNRDNDFNSKIIEILMQNGIDIDAQNNSGMTALMLCSVKNRPASVQILIDNGADINIKQDLTAKELAATSEIRDIINGAENHVPQNLVKILSNFTHKPMKFTTHTWDFGSLESVFGTFDEAMMAIQKQFDNIDSELKELSPNLHKKISLFLFSKDQNMEESWCSKGDVRVGWNNLNGLQEYCDSGKNAFNFKLKKSIIVDNKPLSTFGAVVNLFKQEIEMRTDFKNLENLFSQKQEELLIEDINMEINSSELKRQFYMDTQKFSYAINKIFDEILKRKEYKNVQLTTKELKDRSIEIRITQIESTANKSANELMRDINDGDFAEIKDALTNLCDWSIESICEDGNFRINYLHSNNVKDIEEINTRVKGFTHILRVYR